MTWNPLSRRLFLRGACGTTLALPFLESLAPKSAQAAGPAKRFIALKTYNPPVVKDWYPAEGASGRSAKYAGTTKNDGTYLAQMPLGDAGSGHTWAPLSEFKETGLSKIVTKTLAPFYDKMLMIRGLDFLPNTNHNDSAFLGNYDSEDSATHTLPRGLEQWPTVDQMLAKSSKFYTSTPAQRTVQVAQGTGRGVSFAGSVGSIKRQPYRNNPKDVFNDLFGMFNGGGGSAPAPMDDGRRLKEGLLVDRVLADYKSTLASPRLGKGDKQHLESFVNHMAELQKKITAVSAPSVSCTKPGVPGAGGAESSGTEVKAKWEALVDVIVAAIICDQTRIATFDVRKALRADGGVLFHNQDGFSGWHGDAHNWGSAAARDRMSAANRWVAENVFLRLMKGLDVPEGNGKTFLDNSIIYWGGELGFNHIPYSIHCLVAGSGGGAIKTGRYLDYIDWNGKAYFAQENGNVITGIPHNQWMNTILQVNGLAPSDYEVPGHKGYGIIQSINKNEKWARGWNMANIGQMLPGIAG